MSSPKSEISEIATNIYIIDNLLYSIPQWGSTYFINEDRKALIDTGPTRSLGTVIASLKRLGVRPEQVDYLITTHIHLDHAGGAGSFARQAPGARVVVHQAGARHLARPEKLIRSMTQARGEGLERYGEVAPLPEDRMIPVAGGEVLKLGDGQSLEIIYAPGHAPHQICIRETRDNSVFTGDAAGVYVADADLVIPATPGPNFDLEETLATIEKIRGLEPSRLCFAHYGASTRTGYLLDAVTREIREWDTIVRKAVKDGGFDRAAAEMTALRRAELEPVKDRPLLYESLSDIGIRLSVEGFLQYYQERFLAESRNMEEQ